MESTLVIGYNTSGPGLSDDILPDHHFPDPRRNTNLVERDAKGDEPLIATIHVDSSDPHCHF